VTNTSRSIESQVERVMQQARKASTTTVYKRGTEIYFGSIATPPNAVMVGTYTPYSPSEWIYEDLEAAEYEAASEPAVAANE
jgi:hypothetical protein